jgi:hypothetical protein
MKKNMLIAIILLLATITACTPSRSVQPAATVTNTPDVLSLPITSDVITVKDNPLCKSPCWDTLSPGVSTEEDVKTYIASRNTTLWPEVSESGIPPLCKAYKLKGGGVSTVNLLIRNGMLIGINKGNVRPYTISQLVELYGPPEYVKSVLGIGPDGQFYVLEVYYPSLGLAYKLYPNQDEVGLLKPDIGILAAYFYAPGEIDNYFLSSELYCVEKESAMQTISFYKENWLRPWTGFGKIEVVPSR